MNSLVVLLAVQILVSLFLIIWVRMKVTRTLDEGDSIARIRREIGAMIVELDGSADRNITVMEDRIRELKDLLAEADKRIVMLSNEKARSWAIPAAALQQTPQSRLSASYGQLSAPREPSSLPLEQAPPTEKHQETPMQYVQAPAVQMKLQTETTVPSEQMGQPAPAGPVIPGSSRTASIPFIRFSDKPVVIEEPFAERVARLHKRGFSSDIIAAKLKATIAEVDLAIAAGWNPPAGRGEG
jgi:hypothetical protein